MSHHEAPLEINSEDTNADFTEPASAHRRLWFGQAVWLRPVVEDVAYMSRWDPDITRQYDGDPVGAVLEAAQRKGILDA